MRRLITAALPYVNNIPHLGNLIQGLSGDVFARYSRACGHDTLYICGTDEYGTATETRAREEGVTPRELCDHYYAVHDTVYRWFNFSFDIFGRTSHPVHTEVTQSIFNAVRENDYIVARTTEQLYSEESRMFLADRYVTGTCPHCRYDRARGDQCEQCGTLLDPSDLVDARSAIDGSVPIKKKTRHLYLNLPKLLPLLGKWLKESNAEQRWVRNAMRMTQAWMRDGLQERAITRDLSWGIPVPVDEYKNKVFYVWFDAPIGYISITAQLTDQWREWWQNPGGTRLYQFVGKDNIPFHTVMFPCSLLATHQSWTMLHHISSTEYLNYEGGQFSKSRGVGVFGTDAIESGIPADVWRFYLLYNRPESSDYDFTWADFAERTNKELIGNFANFFNRLTSFVHRYYDGRLPTNDTSDAKVAAKVDASIAEATQHMRDLIATVATKLEALEIRGALHAVLRLSDIGNRFFQHHEPWKRGTGTGAVLCFLLLVARNLSILIAPFLPQTAERCRMLLGVAPAVPRWSELESDDISEMHIRLPQVLFRRLEAADVARLEKQFNGTQSPPASDGTQSPPASDTPPASGTPPASDGTPPASDTPPASGTQRVEEHFVRHIKLIAARIVSVAKHQNADALFVEQVDDGSGTTRQIVSGLARHYDPQELMGKTVIIVDNLKPITLRGEISNGMLLAASNDDDSVLEVLEVNAEPGTQLHLDRIPNPLTYEYRTISLDQFLDAPIRVIDNRIVVGDAPLLCDGSGVRAPTITHGTVS